MNIVYIFLACVAFTFIYDRLSQTVEELQLMRLKLSEIKFILSEYESPESEEYEGE